MADENKTIVDQAKALWAKLTLRRKITLGAVLAVTVAGIAAVSLRTETVKEAVLFSGLPAEEAGSIVKELDTAKVPYRLDQGGSTILVPEARLAEIKLQMATAGLPKGGGYGFADFNNAQGFGQTKFKEQKSYQQALAGELSRSIQTLDAVEKARVMLAMPEDKLFSKAQEPPTASVVLTLRRGFELNPKQVKGIVHLVSSAVPQLRPTNVSVVAESGDVLWSGDDSGDADVAQRDLERILSKRISDLTAPIVGPKRAVITVTSELDHSITERTEETFDPSRVAIRSQTRSEELVQNAGNPNGGGVAGTRSNLPGTYTGALAGSATATGTERRKTSETQNNEISRIIAKTQGPKVQLKRLTVAVLIDGELASDVPTIAPVQVSTVTSSTALAAGLPVMARKKNRVWTTAQLDQIAALARDAAGLDAARGDRITVSCQPFYSEDEVVAVAAPAPPVPAWQAFLEKQPPLVLAAVAGALLLLVLLAVAIVVVRKRRRAVLEPIAMPALPLRVAEVDQALAGEVPAATAAETAAEALPDPRTLALEAAKADPVRAARILSAWLAESMPQAPTAVIPAPAPVNAEGAR